MWYNPNNVDDWGWDQTSSRIAQVIGLNDFSEFTMKPLLPLAPMLAPDPGTAASSPFIHYVRLGESQNGLAAMMENPNSNDPNWPNVAGFSEKWGP